MIINVLCIIMGISIIYLIVRVSQLKAINKLLVEENHKIYEWVSSIEDALRTFIQFVKEMEDKE